MPTVIPQEFMCAGIPAEPSVIGCENASRVEWEVLDKPLGAQVIFSDDTSPDSTIDVTQDGPYKLRLCCYYDTGVVTAPVAPELQVTCPKGVLAGQVANIQLLGCEDGTVEWTVTGVATTGITGNNTGAVVTTDPDNAGGGAIVSVTCTQFDIDGNETTEIRSCSFITYPADSQLVCTTSPAVTSEFVVCGTICECTDVTLVFDCDDEQRCQSAELGMVFIECPECEEPEPCEPLERLEFLGVDAAQIAACNDLLSCCDVDLCCDPHLPVLLWNDICNCPGWTIDAPAIEGSSIYNACGCNIGQKWCFEGSATIVASGPAQFIDVMVVWGHNITDGSISTSPLAPFGGGPTGVGVINDGACIEGYTQPVVINFDQVNAPITDFTATITAAGPGPTCIDKIFIGRKMFLPDDRLPISFVNPHDGDDYELEVKETDCGILSQSIKQVPCDWSLEICADDEWMCEEWRPFLRYARRHGFMFQWSRNRKPNDIINAWISGKQQGSTSNEFGESTVTLNARGFITQPQVKQFA